MINGQQTNPHTHAEHFSYLGSFVLFPPLGDPVPRTRLARLGDLLRLEHHLALGPLRRVACVLDVPRVGVVPVQPRGGGGAGRDEEQLVVVGGLVDGRGLSWGLGCVGACGGVRVRRRAEEDGGERGTGESSEDGRRDGHGWDSRGVV